MRVSKLEAPLLNFWVAKSLGLKPRADGRGDGSVSVVNAHSGQSEAYQPCIDWSQAGPILADSWYDMETTLIEWFGPHWPHLEEFRATPLLWFMRALVANHFGEEVEDIQAEN